MLYIIPSPGSGPTFHKKNQLYHTQLVVRLNLSSECLFKKILRIDNDEAKAALRKTKMLFCCTDAPSTGGNVHYINNKHFPSTLDEKYHLISPVRDSWSLFRQSSETERQKYTWDRLPIYHQTHSTRINHPVNRFKFCKRLYEKRRQDKRFYFGSENASAQTSVVNLNHCWGNRNSRYYHLLPIAARMVGSGAGPPDHEQNFRCLFAENSRWIVHRQKEMKGQNSTRKYVSVKWFLTVPNAHTFFAWGQIYNNWQSLSPREQPLFAGPSVWAVSCHRGLASASDSTVCRDQWSRRHRHPFQSFYSWEQQ